MAINPAELARRFEPILHFHQEERFFPSDAKRYIEACALWSGAGDDKATWGPGGSSLPRTPVVGRGMIAARDGEPGTFLGRTQPPDLLSGTFLDLAGWEGGEDATAASDNRYANLAKIATLYNASPADGGDRFLTGSRFWYHAEVFDAPRLRLLASPANQDTPPGFQRPSQAAVASLKDPALVCYYLFFPGCDDPLEGCEFDVSKRFGAFAGDWACIAVLLEGSGNQTKYKPKFIGLTSRNPGAIQFLGDSRRTGMQVFDWQDARPEIRLLRPGVDLAEHPRIFVARGNHGLYLQPGDQAAAPFSPDDLSKGNCGLKEALEPVQANAVPPDDDEGFSAGEWFLIIVFFPFSLLGLAGASGFDGVGTLEAISPPQIDHAPNAGMFGKVVHPNGVNPPDVNPDAEKISWPKMTSEANLTSTIDGRLYSLLVDRVNPDPKKRQIQWPTELNRPGFNGRWGPRVTSDPKDRRAGMAFPDYWEMFLSALAKKLSL